MKIKLTYKIIKDMTTQEKLRSILIKKYPNGFIPEWYSVFYLYEYEAEKIFNEKIYRRYRKVIKWGYPKECPINKYLKEPTLF